MQVIEDSSDNKNEANTNKKGMKETLKCAEMT